MGYNTYITVQPFTGLHTCRVIISHVVRVSHPLPMAHIQAFRNNVTSSFILNFRFISFVALQLYILFNQ